MCLSVASSVDKCTVVGTDQLHGPLACAVSRHIVYASMSRLCGGLPN
jgi:hypothetical protein